jgi:hypothetical protein
MLLAALDPPAIAAFLSAPLKVSAILPTNSF